MQSSRAMGRSLTFERLGLPLWLIPARPKLELFLGRMVGPLYILSL